MPPALELELYVILNNEWTREQKLLDPMDRIDIVTWLNQRYGIKPNPLKVSVSNDSLEDPYIIIDPKKYQLFQLKYSEYIT